MTDRELKTRHYTGAGGLRLAADVGGDPSALTVIFMHGGGQTRHSWRRATRQLLDDGYQVVSLDARGHGDSDWSPEGDYGLPSFAADLLAVIATLSAPPAIVGASLGGSTGLYAIGNSTEPIARALVLVDIVPRVDAVGSEKILAFMRSRPDGFATVAEAADAVAAYNPHRPRPSETSGLMKNLRRRADGRLHWHWDPKIVEAPTRLEPPDLVGPLLDAASRVRIPTLLIRGLMSDVVSDTGIAELRATLPGLEVQDVAQAGHMVAGDRNDAFNLGVSAFLRRHLPCGMQSPGEDAPRRRSGS